MSSDNDPKQSDPTKEDPDQQPLQPQPQPQIVYIQKLLEESSTSLDPRIIRPGILSISTTYCPENALHDEKEQKEEPSKKERSNTEIITDHSCQRTRVVLEVFFVLVTTKTTTTGEDGHPTMTYYRSILPQQNTGDTTTTTTTTTNGIVDLFQSTQQQQQSRQLSIQFLPNLSTAAANDNNDDTDDTPTNVKITIQERDPQGFTFIIFSNTLQRVDTTKETSTNNDSWKNCNPLDRGNHWGSFWDWTLRLFQWQHETHRAYQRLQTEYRHLDRAREAWQTTAESLAGKWEREKSELCTNFCTLYNAKKQHDREIIQNLQTQIQTLQTEIQKLQEDEYTQRNHPRSKLKTDNIPLPVELQNQPTDHDQIYDEATVERLSRRNPQRLIDPTSNHREVVPEPRLLTKNTKKDKKEIIHPRYKRQRIDDDNHIQKPPSSTRSSSNRAVAKIPKIYQNADEAIAEMEQTQNQQQQCQTTEQQQEQRVTKRKAASNKKNKTAKNDSDDSDSTASKNDLLVDKNMEQDILKQLEALR